MGLFDNWVNQYTQGWSQQQKEADYQKAVDFLRGNQALSAQVDWNDPSAIYRRYVEATTDRGSSAYQNIPLTEQEKAYNTSLGLVQKFAPGRAQTGSAEDIIGLGNTIQSYYDKLKGMNFGTAYTPEQLVQKWLDDKLHWDKENERIASLWDADALKALQYAYNPDPSTRQSAIKYLNEKLGTTNWNYIQPHVMETGRMLGGELPDFLKQHQGRYEEIKRTGEEGEAAKAKAIDDFGREKYYLLLAQTYDPDVNRRQAAIAELDAAFGKNRWLALKDAGSFQNPFATKNKSITELVAENLARKAAEAGTQQGTTQGTQGGWNLGNVGTTTGNTTYQGGYTGGQGLQNTTGQFNQAGTDWINLLMKLAGFIT
jgi:hypothetical protein